MRRWFARPPSSVKPACCPTPAPPRPDPAADDPARAALKTLEELQRLVDLIDRKAELMAGAASDLEAQLRALIDRKAA